MDRRAVDLLEAFRLRSPLQYHLIILTDREGRVIGASPRQSAGRQSYRGEMEWEAAFDGGKGKPFVGDTEGLTEQLLYALMDLQPNVCFRDETDQEDSGRDAYQGDSGVSARIRQAFMEFEADERIRGRVLFVKATNRPDLMDAAMKRDGRAGRTSTRRFSTATLRPRIWSTTR